MKTYIINFLLAFDQLANVIFAGEPDETLSARAYRLELNRRRKWPRVVIDTLFFFQKDHCYKAYISEFERNHLPNHYRTYSENF